MAFLHHFAEQALHRFNLSAQYFQLGKFSLRQFLPARGGWRDVAKSKKEPFNLIERETQLTCALDDGEAVQHRGVIPALAADALRGKKNANLLVVADG